MNIFSVLKDDQAAVVFVDAQYSHVATWDYKQTLTYWFVYGHGYWLFSCTHEMAARPSNFEIAKAIAKRWYFTQLPVNQETAQ